MSVIRLLKGLFVLLAAFSIALAVAPNLTRADSNDTNGSATILMTGQTCPANCITFTPALGLFGAKSTFAFTAKNLTASGGAIGALTSQDGITFNPALITAAVTGTSALTQTSDGEYIVNAAGRPYIQIVVSTVGSGTVTIAYSISSGLAVSGGGSGGGGGSVTQGTVPWVVNTPAPLASCGSTTVPSLSCVSGYPGKYASAAVAVATAAAISLSGTPRTVNAITFSWFAPTVLTGCAATVYDSSGAPTLGLSFIYVIPLTTSAPGAVSIPLNAPYGVTFVNGVWIAVETTATGSTPCNAAAGQLYVMATFANN